MAGYVFLSIALASIAIVNLWKFQRDRDGRWHHANGRKMRRRLPSGEWQYRDMSGQEVGDSDVGSVF